MSITIFALLDNALVVVFLITAWLTIKTCLDGERLAVIRGSRYVGLKGPDPVFRIPFYDSVVSLRIGDTAVLEKDGSCLFHDVRIPVEITGGVEPGSTVSIVDFTPGPDGSSCPLVAPYRAAQPVPSGLVFEPS